MPISAADVIESLGLAPHPEGGFFREVYRAPRVVEHPAAGGAARSASTAIYFLLAAGDFSAWHRVRTSDEAWHHYAGDPLELHLLGDGGHERRFIGGDLAIGAPMTGVPADRWQAAQVAAGGDWSLCGCTVAPGFDFADFEMARRDALLTEFPDCAGVIEALIRG